MKRSITECDARTYENLRYFEVDIDGGKPFDYRARTSFNAFFNLVNHPERHSNDKVFYCQRSLLKFEIDEGVKVIPVPSLWEFYKLIGYNYKAKKYEPN